MKYIKRILGLIPFLLLNIIGMIFNLFRLGFYWMKYGGEANAYNKSMQPKMLADLYHSNKNIVDIDYNADNHEMINLKWMNLQSLTSERTRNVPVFKSDAFKVYSFLTKISFIYRDFGRVEVKVEQYMGYSSSSPINITNLGLVKTRGELRSIYKSISKDTLKKRES